MERAKLIQPQPSTQLEKDLESVRTLHNEGFTSLVIIGINPTDDTMKLYYPWWDVHPRDLIDALKNTIHEIYSNTGMVP